MNNLIKEEKGAALAMTLITMAVLMIFGTVLLNVSSAENKFAEHSEDKVQAYYIARAGAQSVAESLIKGDDAEFIFGETSIPYTLGGGEFTVSVSEPIIIDDNIQVEITSVGVYNNIEQTVTIMVEGTAQGAGMFNNVFYAFKDISVNGNLKKSEISGDMEAGVSIDIKENKLPDKVNTSFPVKYEPISITIPEFTSGEIFNSSKTINAPDVYKVNSISMSNSNKDKLEVTGTGVVSLFLYGDASLKGDISVSPSAQLHIYVIGNHSVTFQGNANTQGKIFIYAPTGSVVFESVTNTELKGLIIAGNIELKNHIVFDYDASVYDAIIEENWLDTSNIGVGYTGYTWTSND